MKETAAVTGSKYNTRSSEEFAGMQIQAVYVVLKFDVEFYMKNFVSFWIHVTGTWVNLKYVYNYTKFLFFDFLSALWISFFLHYSIKGR